VLGSRVLTEIFGPRMDEETGKLRKLHIEKLSGLYCSHFIARVINQEE